MIEEERATARPLLIDGQWRRTNNVVESVDPLTGEPIGAVASGGAPEIDAAVRAAQRAYPAWRNLGDHGRRRVLRRLHAALVERKDQFTDLIHREVGKAPFEALAIDVLPTLNTLAYYARHGASDLKPERIKPSQWTLIGHRVEVVYEPVGVVGVIGPWNLPLALPFTAIVAALAIGNTVVFKPSEWTPLVGHAIAELCEAAAIPRGVVNVVNGGVEAGAALAAHDGTRRIVFIGGIATGRKVAEACARRLCPCILELGDVAAAIVRADVDPELAARGVVWSRFMNAGQICAATQRVFVDQRVADRFIAAVTREVRALRLTRHNGRHYDIGPLINQAAVERVERQVADAVARGATVQTGGERRQEYGATVYAPTVLTGVQPEMAVMREEAFGPVLAIMTVRDDDQAVREINALHTGLATMIWTRDQTAAMALARRIESGMVWINEGATFFADPAIPWGGVKGSGWGHIHGRLGLQELADAKVIGRTFPHAAPWWFPLRAGSQRLISLLIAAQHARNPRAIVRALAEAIFVR